jgi:predicted ATPase
VLTRIEIDGFKSFEGFSLDLSPFAVILGGNASGKSNLFDAIQFLSYLAVDDLRTATRGVRGDMVSLFRQVSPLLRSKRLTFAVEVLLEPIVRDPWGKEAKLSHTRIRYEVEIAHTVDARGLERLTVVREIATPVLSKEDHWRPYDKSPQRAFRDRFLKYSRRTPWLDTQVEDEGRKVTFGIHQDGSAGRTRSGHAAEATVLSSITTTDFPHLYALREELRSWRLLQLDPVGLRRPSPLDSDERLRADGANLAAVLYRIRNETRSAEREKGILPEIVAELSAIIPGVLDLHVEMNQDAREYRTRLVLRDGLEFPTTVISDGTLRVLALLTLLKDPQHRGVVCFEEPENGIHPARLGDLMRRLRKLVTDPTDPDVDPSEPLIQLLMNSHSPVVLSALRQGNTGQVLFADLVVVTDPVTRTSHRKTRIRPIQPTGIQEEMFDPRSRPQVTAIEVQRYLATVNQEA